MLDLVDVQHDPTTAAASRAAIEGRILAAIGEGSRIPFCLTHGGDLYRVTQCGEHLSTHRVVGYAPRDAQVDPIEFAKQVLPPPNLLRTLEPRVPDSLWIRLGSLLHPHPPHYGLAVQLARAGLVYRVFDADTRLHFTDYHPIADSPAWLDDPEPLDWGPTPPPPLVPDELLAFEADEPLPPAREPLRRALQALADALHDRARQRQRAAIDALASPVRAG